MSKPIIMPRFGMTQEDATIVRWLVAEGAKVEQGDPICEVTTDKVNMEVEAPADGILSGILHQEGDTVPVTEVIAYLLAEGEFMAEAVVPTRHEPPAAEKPPERPSPPAVDATPLARRIADDEGIALDDLQGSGVRGKITSNDIRSILNSQVDASPKVAPHKISASPAARHLAEEYGIPLEVVNGTGSEGRIQGWDILEFKNRPRQGVYDKTSERPGVEVIPLEGINLKIAERLQSSYQQAPHIFLDVDIDMERAVTLREALNPRQPAGRPAISITTLIVKACTSALQAQPLMNSHFVDGKILRFETINIGVAVARETGLIVPVVHHAEKMSLNDLGDQVADLSARARDNKLAPDDVTDGTFTISNLGMFKIDRFSAIINPPQVGILAIGRVTRRFVPDENDKPVVRSMMTAALSADHRVIDGLAAARFLNAFRDSLENPNLLLE